MTITFKTYPSVWYVCVQAKAACRITDLNGEVLVNHTRPEGRHGNRRDGGDEQECSLELVITFEDQPALAYFTNKTCNGGRRGRSGDDAEDDAEEDDSEGDAEGDAEDGAEDVPEEASPAELSEGTNGRPSRQYRGQGPRQASDDRRGRRH